MEKTSQSAVVPLDGGWVMLGLGKAWLNKVLLMMKGMSVSVGPWLLITKQLHSLGEAAGGGLGIDDMALIATDDTVLAMPRSRKEVKSIVAELEAHSREESFRIQGLSPWGLSERLWCRVLVKQIL